MSRDSSAVVPPGARRAVPFLDLKAQYAQIKAEVKEAVARVLESQQFILGPEVAALEEELKPRVGCRHAIGCASGSDALLLALMALNLAPDDEVITSPFTFVATAGSVAHAGARPVFVDIDPHTYNLDPKRIEAAITPRTKAVIPVHLYGVPADMDPILEVASRHGIAVIEDAAQAIGASYRGKDVGGLGKIGCFSFFPTKNLGGAGDGGLITTNDEVVADRLRMLRVHGSRSKYEYELLGINSRLDAIQAAILRVKLRHLDQWTAGRQRNAAVYFRLFADLGLDECVALPTIPGGSVHVYNQFTIRVQRRDELREHLSQRGIATEIYYPYPLHLQPAFAALGYRPGSCPNAELACREVLSLPIYSELESGELQRVVESIAEFLRP